jgi:serine/threonine-protein kinase
MRIRVATGIAIVLVMALSVARADTLPRFPAGAVWYQDVSAAALHPQSANMISTWVGLGGFGLGRMQIDFGFKVVHAAAGAPTRSIVGLDYFSPDCEPVGSAVPVPANSEIEAVPGLTCDNFSEDCHLLVVQDTTLYEVYRANALSPTTLQAQCLAVWDLSQVYPAQGRGEHCTSADAAGFPIAPLLINADEVFAAAQVNGDLGHAVRFILPNERMATDASLGGNDGKLYVRPASHAGGPVGPVGAVPYGARLRLRADFPLTNYNPAAQVILRTLKRYGMVLADGGNIALTAEGDRYTTHTWSELNLSSRVFDQTAGAQVVQAGDFQVIDTGARIAETYDCVRTVLGPPPIFADGFE